MESRSVSCAVEACEIGNLRVLLRKFKRRGVADEALQHIPSRECKARILAWWPEMSLIIVAWLRLSHTVPCQPDFRLHEGRHQATVQTPQLFSFRLQNFNVLFADFEQLHVVVIANKVERDRDKLFFWFNVMIRVHHLNINDNVLSTQVIRTVIWEDT